MTLINTNTIYYIGTSTKIAIPKVPKLFFFNFYSNVKHDVAVLLSITKTETIFLYILI